MDTYIHKKIVPKIILTFPIKIKKIVIRTHFCIILDIFFLQNVLINNNFYYNHHVI